jgi:hypothetical protein
MGDANMNEEFTEMFLQAMVALLSLGLAVMGVMLMGRWI